MGFYVKLKIELKIKLLCNYYNMSTDNKDFFNKRNKDLSIQTFLGYNIEVSGNFYFDDIRKQGYILTNSGFQIFTSPMFDFFHGFININTLLQRMSSDYNQEQFVWFVDKLISWKCDNEDYTQFYNDCRSYFNF